MKLDAKRFLVFFLIVGMLIFSMLVLEMPWELIPLTAGVVGLVAVMNRLNRELLEDERKKLDPEWLPYIQSPEVDKVLSRYYVERTRSHKERPELDSTKAWSDYGLGEMRALLHQSLNVSCKDETIVTFCRPAWLLAWIHARKDVMALQRQHEQEIEAERQKLEDTVSRYSARLEEEQERYRSVEPGILAAQEALKKEQDAHALTMERLEDEVSKFKLAASAVSVKNGQLRYEVDELTRVVDELKQEKQNLIAELVAMKEQAESDMQEKEPPSFDSIAQRNEAVVEYKKNHSYSQTADHFGLSEGNVKKIVSSTK